MGVWKKATLIGLGCVVANWVGFGLAYLVESYEMSLSEPFPWLDVPESTKSGLHDLFRTKGPIALISTVLFVSVLGPILEEMLFRAWLRRNQAGWLLAGWGLMIFFVNKAFIIFFNAPVESRTVFAGFMLATYFLWSRSQPEHAASLSNIDSGRRVSMVWILVSILGFGYIHTTNYRDAQDAVVFLPPWHLMDKYVAGAFFAWVRLKYGFRWGVYAHAFNNSVGALLLALFSLLRMIF